MKRLFFTTAFLFVMICGTSAVCSEMEIIPEQIQYRKLAISTKDRVTKLAIASYQTLNLSFLNDDSHSAVDYVLLREGSDSFAMVKYGFEPSDKSILNRLLKVKGSEAYLFHGKNSDGLPTAIYFNAFSRSDAVDLLQKIRMNRGPGLSRRFDYESTLSSLILPRAEAQKLQKCDPNAMSETNQQADKTIFAKTFGAITGCASGAIRGVWASTGGLVTGLFNGNIWTGTKSAVNGIKNLFLNFKSTLASTYALKDLPIEDQAKLFCEVIGLIGTNVIATIVTDGILAIHGATWAYGRATLLIRGALATAEARGSYKNQLKNARCVEENQPTGRPNEKPATQ